MLKCSGLEHKRLQHHLRDDSVAVEQQFPPSTANLSEKTLLYLTTESSRPESSSPLLYSKGPFHFTDIIRIQYHHCYGVPARNKTTADDLRDVTGAAVPARNTQPATAPTITLAVAAYRLEILHLQQNSSTKLLTESTNISPPVNCRNY